MTGADGRRAWILVLDTATSEVVVAAGDRSGRLLGLTTRQVGHRHGEDLLPSIGRLTGEANLRRSRIEAVVVGTGPGGFTGLRVGLATAKTLAHELGCPLVGVSTAEALLRAASAAGSAAGEGRRPVLVLPAGPSDRVVARPGRPPERFVGPGPVSLDGDERLVALDLADRAPGDALAAGEAARRDLAASLLALALERLALGDRDDPATLVPEYVSAPRGVPPTTAGSEGSQEVAWSRGRP